MQGKEITSGKGWQKLVGIAVGLLLTGYIAFLISTVYFSQSRESALVQLKGQEIAAGVFLIALGFMAGYFRRRKQSLTLQTGLEKSDGREEFEQDQRAMETLIRERTAQFETSNELLSQRIDECSLAGKALEEQLHFLQNLIDTIPSPIFYKDVQLRYTGCNTAFEVLVGLAREKIIGKTIEEIFPEEQANFFRQSDLRVLYEVGSENYETTVTSADASRREMVVSKAAYLDVNGVVAGLVGVMTDITGRKSSEAERILLATVIEQAEENVLITDDHRTILYINPAFERSSGYRCEELKGKKLKALRSDQHDNTFYRVMKRILDQGEVWMGVIINKGKDGTDFEIEGTISPIRDTSGAVSHFVAVGRNMSRFRNLERELQQVQKMDALGILAGGIAHDFNNVLTAIMGLVELESVKAGAESQTRYRMEQALAACCRARDLVKQILTFSHHSEQRRKPIEIGPVVEDALKMLRASLPATIRMHSDLQSGGSAILGDPTQIHQVLVNLCTNAAHAMHKTGGRLEIGLTNLEINAVEASEHLDLMAGPYLRLTIRDTGHGMDRKTLERIFEPFYTTKGPGEGAGMGLAVVHGIVKSHGGIITVASEPAKGSTFEVFFPRLDCAVEQVEEPAALFPSGQERILLVDDEPIVIAVVGEMLENIGYEVVAVPKSLEALELFRSQTDRFDLILTDHTMPNMTGMELALELLRIRDDIPIILCTGFTSSEIREKAMAMGIREVITKPFVLQELAARVRNILEEDRALGRKPADPPPHQNTQPLHGPGH